MEYPLICTNWNLLHPWMYWTKFTWNYPRASGEEEFEMSVMYFKIFAQFPLNTYYPCLWYKHECILSKDNLSKGFSNLTPRFVNEFPIFSQYFLPLLSWLPLTKDYFVPSLFQIGHMILKKAVGYVFSFCSLLPFWKRLTLWNKILPFIGINLNPIYQRTHDKKHVLHCSMLFCRKRKWK